MPVALDPNETFPYVICTDRLKPEDQQPRLLFYFVTGREQRKIAHQFDEAMEAANLGLAVEMIGAAISPILAGWENFRDRQGNLIPFNADDLDAVLSDNDFIELAKKLLKELSFAEMDKKKFAFSALSNLEVSAKDAPAGNASPSPRPNPPSSNASGATEGSGSDANSVTVGESSD